MLNAGCILPQLGAQAFLAVIKDMDDWSAGLNGGYWPTVAERLAGPFGPKTAIRDSP